MAGAALAFLISTLTVAFFNCAGLIYSFGILVAGALICGGLWVILRLRGSSSAPPAPSDTPASKSTGS
jgi:hypothetical protein